MAILWIEGFEGIGTTGDATGLTGKYATVSQPTGLDVAAGRLSGYALHINNASAYIETPNLGNIATFIVGFAFNPSSVNTDRILWEFREGGDRNLNIRMTSGGRIAVYRDTTLLATSGVISMLADTWMYLECKVTTHDTTGAYEVRLDGVNILSATGVDTKAGSNNYSTFIRIRSDALSVKFDDIYILDDSGSENNNFLGNCRVVALEPDAEGDEIDWTPSTGTDNSDLVDENPVNDDTDYVEASVANDRDLYTYTDMPVVVGGIKGIQINTWCRETDASTFSLKTPCKSGATESDDSAQVIGSSSYVCKRRIMEQDPNTSAAWTATNLDAAQFGVKVG